MPLGADPARFLVDKPLTDWFGMFLLMPVFVPILISSQSVAGEKERRTLEPLLASPVTAAELVLGKSLASVVPAVAITWMCLRRVRAWRWTSSPGRWCTRPLLPNAMWLFGVGIVAPLFAFFGQRGRGARLRARRRGPPRRSSSRRWWCCR